MGDRGAIPRFLRREPQGRGGNGFHLNDWSTCNLSVRIDRRSWNLVEDTCTEANPPVHLCIGEGDTSSDNRALVNVPFRDSPVGECARRSSKRVNTKESHARAE